MENNEDSSKNLSEQVDVVIRQLQNKIRKSKNNNDKNCTKCQNHGKKERVKNHKLVCPYKRCDCERCSDTDRKRLLASLKNCSETSIDKSEQISEENEKSSSEHKEINQLQIDSVHFCKCTSRIGFNSQEISKSVNTIDEKSISERLSCMEERLELIFNAVTIVKQPDLFRQNENDEVISNQTFLDETKKMSNEYHDMRGQKEFIDDAGRKFNYIGSYQQFY